MAFHGLFIGVDRYASPEIKWLNCARRDAEALEALFADTLGGSTTLLADEDATRKNILNEFEKLAHCGSDDTVVIAFSGHGSETHEIVTYDADRNDLLGTSITLELLKERFSAIPARQVILLLDCCFSGGIGAKVLRVNEIPRSLESVDAHFAKLAGDGRIILTASGSSEPAWETQKHGHGFFTHVLLEALQGPEEIVSENQLSLYPLLEYVVQRVTDFAQQIGHEQTPTLRGAVDGVIRWPVFIPGTRFKAAFPDYSDAKVTPDVFSLAAFGFPAELIAAWSEVIPTLNELQVDAINEFGILNGEHVVVSAPTSSGKTMIGELAALRCVQDHRRALFLFPLKALVADKARYFDEVYGTFGIRTIEATGESDDITDLLRGQYDIALLTYEKFAAIALSYPHVLEQVGTIVVDETQMLADGSRGANLEFLLTLIRMQRREEIEPQIISLSAVIGDMNGLDHWIGGRLLRREKRPVPLEEGILLGDGRFRYLDAETFEEKCSPQPILRPHYSGKSSSQDLIIPLVKKLIDEGKQVIVFREMKGETRGCARYLANALDLPAAATALEQLPGGDLSQASTILREVLGAGIAFHNADLDPRERRTVEEEFRKKDSDLKVIVATTTLAMGVNTPAAAVVIAGLMHPGGTAYSVAEYKNLIGRAGRLGFSEYGTSYLIAKDSRSEHSYWDQYVKAQPENLESRFLSDDTDPRSLIVRVLVATSKVREGGLDADGIAEFLEASFGAFQMARQNGGWSWSRDQILEALSDLTRHDLVEQTEAAGFRLTELGRIAGESSVEVDSVIRLVDCLKPLQPSEITDPTLITIIQTTKEVGNVLLPINKRSTQKEPQTWLSELRNQNVPDAVLRSLNINTRESHEQALRAKKAVACLLYISGREMSEIEAILTQFGRPDGAAGPVRAVTSRTCDLLPAAARIAELLHPTLKFQDRVGRLAVRLTHGIPGSIVELARYAGASLTRGNYVRLDAEGFSDPDSIIGASDDEILACVDNDRQRLTHVREAAQQLRASRKESVGIDLQILKPYEG